MIRKLIHSIFGLSKRDLRLLQVLVDSIKTPAGKIDYLTDVASTGLINEEEFINILNGVYR